MSLRGLIMPDYVGAFNEGEKIGQERRTRKTLSQYLQPALGGDQSALSQIYSADPEAGMKAQQLGQQQQTQSRERNLADLKQAAALYSSAPPEIKADLYGKIRTLAEQAELLPPGKAPMTLDTPEAQQGFEKFISAIGGGSAAEEYTLSPGAKRFRGNQEVASAPFAPERPDFVLSADGTQWLPKPTGMPQGAPQASVGGFGISETDNYVKNIMGNAGPIDPNASPEQIVQSLLPHVIQQESGGNPNAVSPKGAQGLMQVMPETGRDPGFGVRPMQGKQDNVRFGRDYLTAMVKRYPGRPDLALAAYNAGPGVADRFSQPSASASGGAIPIPGARPKSEMRAPSDIERRLELAQSMGASPEQMRQMVIGREGAAAGAKPMPVAALKLIQEETNAANTATAINTSLDKHLKRIEDGDLDFGPVANNIYAARNATGQSTKQSRNFAEFKSDLEKLRNDSLRLNAGVQTDGDAQRAWNELVANINDTDYVKQRLATIRKLNERAMNLRRMNVDMIKENYGRGEGSEQPTPKASASRSPAANDPLGIL